MSSSIRHRAEAVRQFNRFYTRRIGVLNESLLDSSFSLAEVRVLYELAHRGDSTAGAIAEVLGLDAGYLSRILRGFLDKKFIRKTRSESDGRQSVLSLTARGRKAIVALEDRSNAEVASMLAKLSEAQQHQLLDAMQSIEHLLNGEPPAQEAYILRAHQPGDMGWIVHRHGVLYSQEHGWTDEFEAFVAEIVAKFLRTFDPKREHCWIAERDGEIAGSVFLVKETKATAKLRLLYVEPNARGLGIGRRLVDECIRFARSVGYRKITLWTNDVLTAARRVYERAGFRLVEEKRHHSFGHDLTGQTWELDLTAPALK